MSAILVVEDDPILGKSLAVNLELEGYKVVWARDLKSAFQENSQNPFDLVILDLGLPDGNGMTFCTKLREEGAKIPIIILTAVTDEDSVVKGLYAGANDYIRKPFGNRELIARIKTALREPLTRSSQLRFGDLLVLLEERKLFHGQAEVDLNRREFDILSYLIQNAGAVVTRESLLRSLDKDGEIFDRTIDSHMSHIRTKLREASVKSPQITSVYGVGYRLEK